MPPEFVPADRAGVAERVASARESKEDERTHMLAKEIARNIVIVRRDDPNRRRLLPQDMTEEESRIEQLSRSMRWKLQLAQKEDTTTKSSGGHWSDLGAGVQERAEELSNTIAEKFRAFHNKQSVQEGE